MEINALCKKVLEITDSQLDAATAEAERQLGYMHPLKMGTAGKVHSAGRHNLAVAQKLRELRDTIRAGAPEQANA